MIDERGQGREALGKPKRPSYELKAEPGSPRATSGESGREQIDELKPGERPESLWPFKGLVGSNPTPGATDPPTVSVFNFALLMLPEVEEGEEGEYSLMTIKGLMFKT